MDNVYPIARRILLDALAALAPHRDALTLVGAQAIYVRLGEADFAVAPTTNDGDLSLDPVLLAEKPAIEKLLANAQFDRRREENGDPRVGSWVRKMVPGASIDLLMAEAVAPGGGRRTASIPGHEDGSIRRAIGLEAALVDADPMTIGAMEAGDSREFTIRVAGPGALLVAKIHKILDRTKGRNRLKDKDALDVFRLLRDTSAQDMNSRLRMALTDPRSADVTEEALKVLPELFIDRGAPGHDMIVRATEGLLDPAEVVASLIAVASDITISPAEHEIRHAQSRFHR